jgi:hypothetical protein
MAPKSGVFKKVDNLAKFMQGVEMLSNTSVMVGVPSDETSRKETGEITNAELAYIHDKGSIDGRIPARPFMQPGLKAVQDQIKNELIKAGNDVFKGKKTITTYLNRVGLIAVRSIKNVIASGIAPPLAPSTVAARIRRVKGKARRQKITDAQARGVPDSRQNGAEGIFTPLRVTNQLFNAITYVLRDQRKMK